ncbi:glycosyltransferase [Tsuneonella sp. HG249]
MSEPDLSVALATCNGERYLRDQLAGLAGQTRPPSELVVCDDRSSDATVAILREFARHAPFPVRIAVNRERLGYARNFRQAAAMCTGELIAFCDQDDWWHPSKLERTAALFHDPRAMLVYHNARVVDVQRQGAATLYDAAAERAKIAVRPFSPWHHSYGMTQVFRADLRRFDGLWNLSRNDVADPVDIMSHDQWYFFLALACGEVRFLDEALVDYRQHAANSVGANPGRRLLRSGILARLEHYGRQDARCAEAARARAEVLRAIAAAEPALRDRALALAIGYVSLEGRHRRRCTTYCGSALTGRLRGLVVSVARGDYRNWPWGFDARSIVRDFISGVVLGRANAREPT